MERFTEVWHALALGAAGRAREIPTDQALADDCLRFAICCVVAAVAVALV